MLTPDERATAASVTRVMQIIIIALVSGASAYLAFAIFNRTQPDGDNNLAMMGAILAASAAPMAVILPVIMAQQQRRTIADGVNQSTDGVTGDDASQVLAAYQTRKIVSASLLDGAVFLNIFAYQSGGPTYSLGISIALILGMALMFPFRRLVEEWLERELRTVRELRELRQ